ncbi:MAG: hypothetical protein HYX69_11175 [Planctomycetia bacterium]|nr:hypothetical protein [Planctomycetia bacterium]
MQHVLTPQQDLRQPCVVANEGIQPAGAMPFAGDGLRHAVEGDTQGRRRLDGSHRFQGALVGSLGQRV